MKKLKGIFKSLQVYFLYIGKNKPFSAPFIWCSKPTKIHVVIQDVGWKDKYNTPRYEEPPYIWISLFGYNFIWYWDLPLHQKKDIDEYWEQALWYLYYYDNISYGRLPKPDIYAAIKSWPWIDHDTKLSTWNNKFLVKRYT